MYGSLDILIISSIKDVLILNKRALTITSAAKLKIKGVI
jgi:hypothetical protein